MYAELMLCKGASTFQCRNLSSNIFSKKRKALGIKSMKRGQKKKQPARMLEHATDQQSDDYSTMT